jgi:1-acyl-sn-glycerol-3-phosphate acyltransferase
MDGSERRETRTWDLLEIGAIQTSSKSVQIAPKAGGLVDFRFQDDSPKRWDGILQRAVRKAYERAGFGEIVEFQPRIATRFGRQGGARREGGLGGGQEEERVQGPEERRSWAGSGPGEGRIPDAGLSWYGFFRGIGKLFVLLGTRTEASGMENVPRSGPFFLVANHQSVLDPILVQTACPRPLHTFTKSTQFSGRLFRWVLIKVKGIPTRRYRIDPQVVRVALRRLAEGKGVGIYPEGERSWDGELQPFRQGTIRLLLRAGVPVVPCGIDGSYDVWPRWSRIVRRRRVRVTFGSPLQWPAMEDRLSREAALPAASQALRDALVGLGAWAMGDGEGENP